MTAVDSAAPPTAHWWDDRLEVAREFTLFALNVVAVISLGRLFIGTESLPPLLTTAVAAHLTFMLLRRANRSLAIAAIILPIAAAFLVTVVFHPGSTFLGIPTSGSFDRIASDLDVAFSLFGDAPTPAEPVTGFLILCAAALWVAAFVADWAAFRLGLPVEAMLPAGTIFVFSAVLADDHQRTLASVVAVVCALAFFLVHRVSKQARSGQWVAGAAGRGSSALIASGSMILVVAVFAAALSGPSLPGADAPPLIELEPSSSPASRVTVSPLVDIRRRLVSQQNVEVFTVKSEERAYWRLTSLDSFNGRIWSSSGSYGRAEGTLEPSADQPLTTVGVEQTFDVNALAAIWLPAAFEPQKIDADIDLRYDEFSSTLIVDTDILDSDGISYTVESELPRFEPDELHAAGSSYPDEIADAQLELPSDFPDSVRDLAIEVAGGTPSEDGGPTTYEAALRLQEFLRGFTYDLTVPSGHAEDDLERFLLRDRAGYCEQFAGSFAAMARSLGMPARVAVGFTPGIEIEPGVFSVRGEHAHAWPEVYFAGLGWVPFEPTPGRGAPGAESYTNVAEQQVQSGGDPNTATTLPTETSTPDQQTSPDEENVDVATAPPAEGEDAASGAGEQTGQPASPLTRWFVLATIAMGIVLLVAVLYVALAFGLHQRRRARRLLAADSPTARVQLAWQESLDDLTLLGLEDDPSATHRETAKRASSVLPTGAEHAETIGRLAETAVYASSGIGDDEVATAERAAGEISTIVHAVTSVSARSKRVLKPRTVLGVGPIRRIGGE